MHSPEIDVKVLGGKASTIEMPDIEKPEETFGFFRSFESYKLPAKSTIKVLFEPGNISLVGVVLYDTRHVHIKSVLKSDIHWKSLDSETQFGPAWNVYVVGMGSPEPDFDKIRQDIAATLEEYGLESTADDLPFFLFLAQQKTTDNCFHNLCISLRDDSPVEAFNSLRQVIRRASSAIRRVERENYANSEEIFYLVKQSFENMEMIKFVVTSLSIIDKIKSALGVVDI